MLTREKDVPITDSTVATHALTMSRRGPARRIETGGDVEIQRGVVCSTNVPKPTNGEQHGEWVHGEWITVTLTLGIERAAVMNELSTVIATLKDVDE